jgi:UDP-GlcNAc:undecaprenyl-phosphate GlcNAc-1-phosphate transferase
VRDYLLTLLVAAAVTYLLTPVVRQLAIRAKVIKAAGDRDVHTAPVPRAGGLAMYAGLAAGLFVASQIPQLHAQAIANTGLVGGLLGAGGLLVIIGFVDDKWGMSSLTKAVGQVAAAGILVATGTQLSWLPMPGGSFFQPTPDQETLLTIVIVVATINAVNFIDGLDGLAAGIVAIAAVSFFAYYYSLTKLVMIGALAAPALASAVLIGACLGFLPHNFAPAKIFMGDTGSMLLGLVLAYAPISAINSIEPEQLTSSINRYPVIMPLLLPVVLLVIPYADLLLAVVRRARAGQSPFVADRKHLHHRLLDFGHSQRASVLIMYLWAAAFSGTVVWLSITRTELPRASNHHGEPIIVFVLTTVAAVGVLLLLSLPWRRWGQEAPGGWRAAVRGVGGPSALPASARSGRGPGPGTGPAPQPAAPEQAGGRPGHRPAPGPAAAPLAHPPAAHGASAWPPAANTAQDAPGQSRHDAPATFS